MAKQIAGLCRLEGTFDQLTFYKMEGQYYVRVKSSLTSKRVKTAPEFQHTMLLAGLMARASKIGAQVYKALPPGWRQFWMYRSFTGEALLLLKHNPYTDEQVKQILWKCYVEYWEERKTIDPNNPVWQPKPKKIRKRRVYTEESWKRRIYRKDKYGRYKYPDLVKADKERIKREAKEATEAWAREREQKKQQYLAKEESQAVPTLLETVLTLTPCNQQTATYNPTHQPAMHNPLREWKLLNPPALIIEIDNTSRPFKSSA